MFELKYMWDSLFSSQMVNALDIYFLGQIREIIISCRQN